MKRTFLAAHDYGMGGVWMLIDASSAAEIQELYPELDVVEERPSFISDDLYAHLDGDVHYDIDAAPAGFLADLIARRGQAPSA